MASEAVELSSMITTSQRHILLNIDKARTKCSVSSRLIAIYLLSTVTLFLIVSSSILPSEGAALNPVGKHRSDRGCYYMLQHFKNGEQIKTDEPCLNCTCENSMLMCYLRVCPYVKPVGDRCIIERVPGECCPKITCSDTGPSLEQEIEPDTFAPPTPSTSTTSTSTTTTTTTSTTPSSSIASNFDVTYTNSSEVLSGAGGCMLNGNYYHEGAQMPSDSSKPCEVCYCIRNSSACVMQDCALEVSGCTPIYQSGGCCPTRYNCSANNAFTTPRPQTTFGQPDSSSRRRFWETLSGGTNPSVFNRITSVSQASDKLRPSSTSTTQRPMALPDFGRSTGLPPAGCRAPNSTRVYSDGERVPSKNKCEHCYCMRSEIVCAVQECRPPCDGCVPIIEAGDQCCPKRYECAAPTQRVPTDNVIEGEEVASSTGQANTQPQESTSSSKAVAELGGIDSGSAIGSTPASKALDEFSTQVFSLTSPSEQQQADSKASSPIPNLTAESPKPEPSVMTTRQTKPPLRPISPKINEDESAAELMPDQESTKPVKVESSAPVDSSANVDGFNLHEREQEADSAKPDGRFVIPEGSQPIATGNQVQEFNEVIPPSLTSAPPSASGSTQSTSTATPSIEQTLNKAIAVSDSLSGQNVERRIRPPVVPSAIPGEGSCRYNGRMYQNGQEVKSKDNCMEICMCINSVVYCDEVDCPKGPVDQDKCKRVMTEGECCPKYICDEDTTPSQTTTPMPSSSSEQTISSTSVIPTELPASTTSDSLVSTETPPAVSTEKVASLSPNVQETSTLATDNQSGKISTASPTPTELLVKTQDNGAENSSGPVEPSVLNEIKPEIGTSSASTEKSIVDQSTTGGIQETTNAPTVSYNDDRATSNSSSVDSRAGIPLGATLLPDQALSRESEMQDQPLNTVTQSNRVLNSARTDSDAKVEVPGSTIVPSTPISAMPFADTTSTSQTIPQTESTTVSALPSDATNELTSKSDAAPRNDVTAPSAAPTAPASDTTTTSATSISTESIPVTFAVTETPSVTTSSSSATPADSTTLRSETSSDAVSTEAPVTTTSSQAPLVDAALATTAAPAQAPESTTTAQASPEVRVEIVLPAESPATRGEVSGSQPTVSEAPTAPSSSQTLGVEASVPSTVAPELSSAATAAAEPVTTVTSNLIANSPAVDSTSKPDLSVPASEIPVATTLAPLSAVETTTLAGVSQPSSTESPAAPVETSSVVSAVPVSTSDVGAESPAPTTAAPAIIADATTTSAKLSTDSTASVESSSPKIEISSAPSSELASPELAVNAVPVGSSDVGAESRSETLVPTTGAPTISVETTAAPTTVSSESASSVEPSSPKTETSYVPSTEPASDTSSVTKPVPVSTSELSSESRSETLEPTTGAPAVIAEVTTTLTTLPTESAIKEESSSPKIEINSVPSTELVTESVQTTTANLPASSEPSLIATSVPDSPSSSNSAQSSLSDERVVTPAILTSSSTLPELSATNSSDVQDVKPVITTGPLQPSTTAVPTLSSEATESVSPPSSQASQPEKVSDAVSGLPEPTVLNEVQPKYEMVDSASQPSVGGNIVPQDASVRPAIGDRMSFSAAEQPISPSSFNLINSAANAASPTAVQDAAVSRELETQGSQATSTPAPTVNPMLAESTRPTFSIDLTTIANFILGSPTNEATSKPVPGLTDDQSLVKTPETTPSSALPTVTTSPVEQASTGSSFTGGDAKTESTVSSQPPADVTSLPSTVIPVSFNEVAGGGDVRSSQPTDQPDSSASTSTSSPVSDTTTTSATSISTESVPVTFAVTETPSVTTSSSSAAPADSTTLRSETSSDAFSSEASVTTTSSQAPLVDATLATTVAPILLDSTTTVQASPEVRVEIVLPDESPATRGEVSVSQPTLSEASAAPASSQTLGVEASVPSTVAPELSSAATAAAEPVTTVTSILIANSPAVDSTSKPDLSVPASEIPVATTLAPLSAVETITLAGVSQPSSTESPAAPVETSSVLSPAVPAGISDIIAESRGETLVPTTGVPAIIAETTATSTTLSTESASNVESTSPKIEISSAPSSELASPELAVSAVPVSSSDIGADSRSGTLAPTTAAPAIIADATTTSATLSTDSTASVESSSPKVEISSVPSTELAIETSSVTNPAPVGTSEVGSEASVPAAGVPTVTGESTTTQTTLSTDLAASVELSSPKTEISSKQSTELVTESVQTTTVTPLVSSESPLITTLVPDSLSSTSENPASNDVLSITSDKSSIAPAPTISSSTTYDLPATDPTNAPGVSVMNDRLDPNLSETSLPSTTAVPLSSEAPKSTSPSEIVSSLSPSSDATRLAIDISTTTSPQFSETSQPEKASDAISGPIAGSSEPTVVNEVQPKYEMVDSATQPSVGGNIVPQDASVRPAIGDRMSFSAAEQPISPSSFNLINSASNAAGPAAQDSSATPQLNTQGNQATSTPAPTVNPMLAESTRPTFSIDLTTIANFILGSPTNEATSKFVPGVTDDQSLAKTSETTPGSAATASPIEQASSQSTADVTSSPSTVIPVSFNEVAGGGDIRNSVPSASSTPLTSSDMITTYGTTSRSSTEESTTKALDAEPKYEILTTTAPISNLDTTSTSQTIPQSESTTVSALPSDATNELTSKSDAAPRNDVTAPSAAPTAPASDTTTTSATSISTESVPVTFAVTETPSFTTSSSSAAPADSTTLRSETSSDAVSTEAPVTTTSSQAPLVDATLATTVAPALAPDSTTTAQTAPEVRVEIVLPAESPATRGEVSGSQPSVSEAPAAPASSQTLGAEASVPSTLAPELSSAATAAAEPVTTVTSNLIANSPAVDSTSKPDLSVPASEIPVATTLAPLSAVETTTLAGVSQPSSTESAAAPVETSSVVSAVPVGTPDIGAESRSETLVPTTGAPNINVETTATSTTLSTESAAKEESSSPKIEISSVPTSELVNETSTAASAVPVSLSDIGAESRGETLAPTTAAPAIIADATTTSATLSTDSTASVELSSPKVEISSVPSTELATETSSVTNPAPVSTSDISSESRSETIAPATGAPTVSAEVTTSVVGVSSTKQSSTANSSSESSNESGTSSTSGSSSDSASSVTNASPVPENTTTFVSSSSIEPAGLNMVTANNAVQTSDTLQPSSDMRSSSSSTISNADSISSVSTGSPVSSSDFTPIKSVSSPVENSESKSPSLPQTETPISTSFTSNLEQVPVGKNESSTSKSSLESNDSDSVTPSINSESPTQKQSSESSSPVQSVTSSIIETSSVPSALLPDNERYKFGPGSATASPAFSNGSVTASPADVFVSGVMTTNSPSFEPVNLTTIIPSIRGSATPITIPWADISKNSNITGSSSTSYQPPISSNFTTYETKSVQHEPTQSSVTVSESDYEEVAEADSGCEYEGKTYNSAQQIPRSNPCDFCFCFRGDIICLQQTCPPPVPHCFETIMDGFCCPRYECPVHTVRSSTNSTGLSLTPYDAHSRLHPHTHDSVRTANKSSVKGCFVDNKLYGVGQVIDSASSSCLECRCDKTGMMKCNPKECAPEDPLLQQINREVLQSTLSRSQVR